ncbi:DUF6218 family protein [Amycolatopsis magusensis]|uniref:Uncharacterized protein n=1 Tax=Amycolatopsis magusensis TaxID=882444 RepID=A0ABS4PVX3_9PSEU|nr:DUF6218 family protein [Amycolatopsis magusensis]MBP2183572.1 hypothetical protein [Amycolatopsis magusensis]
MTSAVVEEVLGDGLAQLRAPGSAVLGVGSGNGGPDCLAVWQVSPLGAPTGAWVMPCEEAFGSVENARLLLSLIERRAIAAGDPAAMNHLLERWSAAADLVGEGAWWTAHLFSPVVAFTETVSRRRRYESTVATAKEAKKSITALEWAHELPEDTTVESFSALRGTARISPAVGVPVVSEVLTTARVLRWLVEVWSDTEMVKNRREYVRAVHGATEPLPPEWLLAVQTAGKTRLPL